MQRQQSRGLPTRAALKPDGLYLALKDIDPAELQDPFMHQSVRRIEAPEVVAHIPVERLGQSDPGAAPIGLIFHVGRCGSTVLSQALKQLDDLAVYSEPLPVNELLSPPAGSLRQVTLALRSLGAAFAAHGDGPFVLKLSSWNTLFCDVLTEAFPNTPWVFCVRDPVEVGEAILRDPPAWLGGESPPARHLTGIVDPASESGSRSEFFARLYAAFCDAIVQIDRRRGRLVRYENLHSELQMLPRHFGIESNATQIRRMIESTQHYAKAPPRQSAPYRPDSEAKRAAASAELRAAADAIARPALHRVLAAYASSSTSQ